MLLKLFDTLIPIQTLYLAACLFDYYDSYKARSLLSRLTGLTLSLSL